MQNQISSEKKNITADLLQGLPEPVQRFMDFAGVVGKPWIETVRLEQTGRFRQKPESSWMPVEAVQYFTTDPPGFQWRAAFKVMGLPLVRARDTYKRGTGHMYGKMAGMYTLFDARGPEMDQGTMLRYLGETIWYPTALLSRYMTWQAVDDQSADVTFTDAGKSVSGRFTFDAEGRPTIFTAQRYGDFDGQFVLRPWIVPMTEYARRDGFTIPVRGQVKWDMPGGQYSYFDWEIGKVEYNRPIEDF